MKRREITDKWRSAEQGHSLVEYGLLVLTITITAIVALKANGAKVCNKINLAGNAVMRSNNSAVNLDPCNPFTASNQK